MLSNKIILFSLLFLSFTFFSCKEKEEPADITAKFDEPEYLLAESKKIIGDNVKKTFKGNFLNEPESQFVAGEEIENKDEWGIKFYLLRLDDNNLKIADNTELLEGSFSDCIIQTIKFPSNDYELIYYNSLNYFLGSGGGDVFSYIIDFKKDVTHYAHLFTGGGDKVSLFISDDTDEEIKNFFISNFKRDYPSLQLVSNDVQPVL